MARSTWFGEKMLASLSSIDYLVRGPLPNIQDVIAERNMDGARRWIAHTRRNLGDTADEFCEALELAVRTGDVNAQVPSGTTCLHASVVLNDDDLMQGLLEARALLEAVDVRGHTPLDRAQKFKHQSCVDVLRRARSERQSRDMILGMELVAKVSHFKRLRPEEYPKVAEVLKVREYPAGQVVVREGDLGDELFIIESGVALVESSSSSSEGDTRLGPLECFGESAVLTNMASNSTVKALESLRVRVLDREDILRLDLASRLRFKGLRHHARVHDNTRSNDCDIKIGGIDETPVTAADKRLIVEAIHGNTNLGPLVTHLGPEGLDEMTNAVRHVKMGSGVEVIVQGELEADHFFVIAEGTFEVIVNGKHVADLAAGASFGEMALLYRAPRAATVRSSSEAAVWTIHRNEFRRLNQASVKQKIKLYSRILSQVELFSESSEDTLEQAADALVEMTFFAGEHIIRQGEVGSTFYVLFSGEVTVQIDGKEVSRLSSGLDGRSVAELVQSDRLPEVAFFGERALLVSEPRAATVLAVSKRVVVMAMHQGVFKVLRTGLTSRRGNRRGSCSAFVCHLASKQTEEQFSKHFAADDTTGSDHSSLADDTMVRYSLSELKTEGVLGSGAFGVVTLVTCKITGQKLALKALAKGNIISEGQEQFVMNEKWVMRVTCSPFIIRLAATFNQGDNLYFLMEAASGGSLCSVYNKRKLWGLEDPARFYTACVFRAFQHLHELNIIYRDLKPENLLLDGDGYCKVTDFGLSKIALGHTYTMCGTPEYFAPEMVNASGHTKAVDWWTLGVLIFELMTSDVPFPGEEHPQIFAAILRGFDHVTFPDPNAAWARLVRELCRPLPSERLALRPGGAENVSRHAWFREVRFDWDDLDARDLDPPFVPTPAKHLPTTVRGAPKAEPYVDPNNGWDLDFEDTLGPADLGSFPNAKTHAAEPEPEQTPRPRQGTVEPKMPEKEGDGEQCGQDEVALAAAEATASEVVEADITHVAAAGATAAGMAVSEVNAQLLSTTVTSDVATMVVDAAVATKVGTAPAATVEVTVPIAQVVAEEVEVCPQHTAATLDIASAVASAAATTEFDTMPASTAESMAIAAEVPVDEVDAQPATAATEAVVVADLAASAAEFDTMPRSTAEVLANEIDSQPAILVAVAAAAAEVYTTPALGTDATASAVNGSVEEVCTNTCPIGVPTAATPRARRPVKAITVANGCAAVKAPDAATGAVTTPRGPSAAIACPRLCVGSPLRQRQAGGGAQRGGTPRSTNVISGSLMNERRGPRCRSNSNPRPTSGVPMVDSPLKMRARRRPTSGCGTPRNPPSGRLLPSPIVDHRM
mmetsp:Transcript_25616/g.68052  ORF Transcript_25616/g.68052 Transcript_25616/m.68052 type:complete len:1331 (+) Transcript_25616:46-4038(+)